MVRVILAIRIFFSLALPYFYSEDRWRARLLLAGIVAAELGLVYVLVLVNQWNARFFNAIELRNWDAAAAELLVFCGIVIAAIASGMTQYWFGQTLQIRWRRWMTQRYVDLWMAEGRHYRLRFFDNSVDNIHLRIGNDVLLFVARTHELCTGLIGSLVTILSFMVILWWLSATTPLPLLGMNLSFPGYLIWTALLYAGIGTFITHLIGWPLISLQFNQQRYESDFRFAIARVTDQSEPVALMRGEKVEREDLRQRFARLVRNWTALVNRQTYLVGFIAGYGKISTVFPTLVVTPAYLAGAITLGTLVQAALAFQQIEGAFAYCISAYSKIAEWKAVMDRLSQFEAVMDAVDQHHHLLAKIEVSEAPGRELQIENLVLRLPTGESIAATNRIDLAPGDRLLVSGVSGTGKSSILRALAGLWPLGDGRILIPRGGMLSLPQRPYFPLGTLRQALAYPSPSTEVDDADIRSAITAVGLGHLACRLDEESEWGTVLSGGEQQRVAFARALIAKPTVLLLDEPVTTLEAADAQELYQVLAERLPETIVVTIGRAASLGHLHGRTVDMTSPPAATRPLRSTDVST